MALTNWSSMAKGNKDHDWYLAASLIALGNEINRAWPRRSTASDGAIGDASHQARKSDHNPDWDAGGVVRAIDIDVHGIDAPAVVKALIGDPRVWYVIYDHYIYSVTYNWAKRPYDGADPHTGHIHVSIRHTTAAETNTGLWLSVTDNHKPDNPFDDWEAIMALFNSKDEFVAAVAAGVKQGNADYWRDFYKDGAGTGDAIWDGQRAAYAAERKENADLLAAVKENTDVQKQVLGALKS